MCIHSFCNLISKHRHHPVSVPRFKNLNSIITHSKAERTKLYIIFLFICHEHVDKKGINGPYPEKPKHIRVVCIFEPVFFSLVIRTQNPFAFSIAALGFGFCFVRLCVEYSKFFQIEIR